MIVLESVRQAPLFWAPLFWAGLGPACV